MSQLKTEISILLPSGNPVTLSLMIFTDYTLANPKFNEIHMLTKSLEEVLNKGFIHPGFDITNP